jgi:hypothetical protein
MGMPAMSLPRRHLDNQPPREGYDADLRGGYRSPLGCARPCIEKQGVATWVGARPSPRRQTQYKIVRPRPSLLLQLVMCLARQPAFVPSSTSSLFSFICHSFAAFAGQGALLAGSEQLYS